MGFRLVQSSLFGCQICFDINMCCLNDFVTKPQCNHTEIDSGPEQVR